MVRGFALGDSRVFHIDLAEQTRGLLHHLLLERRIILNRMRGTKPSGGSMGEHSKKDQKEGKARKHAGEFVQHPEQFRFVSRFENHSCFFL